MPYYLGMGFRPAQEEFKSMLYALLRKEKGFLHFEDLGTLQQVQLLAILKRKEDPSLVFVAPTIRGDVYARFGRKVLTSLYVDLTKLEPPEGYTALVVAVMKALLERTPSDARLTALEKEVGNTTHLTLDEELKPKPVYVASPDQQKAAKRDRGLGHTKLVWILADELKKNLGAMPERKAVIERCVDEGINPGTAGVQYAAWKKTQI